MIESLIERYGYLAILIGTFLEGETILVLGGFAAHRGLLQLPGVIVAAFIGSVLSDQLFFFLGRRHGGALLARRPQWRPGVDRVRGLMDRYSTLLILVFRFLYGLRNVTPFALGMSNVSTAKFVLLNAIGAGVWAIAIAVLGWSVGEAAKHALGHVQRYERALAGGIVAIGIAFWLWHRFRARRAERRQAGARST